MSLSMFFHLLFIHLFRPFLKYRQGASPLPSHVSPRKLCTQAAASISKLFRLYKRTYGLQQICNITVYICHTACTIHLLNLPDKNASRDFMLGVKHLEEIAECWLGARRTLGMLHVVAKRWRIDIPYEAETVLARTDEKYGQNPNHHRHTIKTESPFAGLAQPANQHLASDHGAPVQVGEAHGFTATTPSATVVSRSSRSSPTIIQNSTPQENFVQNPPVQRGHFDLQPEQLELWKQDQAMRNSNAQNPTSPHMLFGGVDALVRDSQDFWFKEEHDLFDHWNAHPESLYNTFNRNGNSNGSQLVATQDAFYGNELFGMNNATIFTPR